MGSPGVVGGDQGEAGSGMKSVVSCHRAVGEGADAGPGHWGSDRVRSGREERGGWCVGEDRGEVTERDSGTGGREDRRGGRDGLDWGPGYGRRSEAGCVREQGTGGQDLRTDFLSRHPPRWTGKRGMETRRLLEGRRVSFAF